MRAAQGGETQNDFKRIFQITTKEIPGFHIKLIRDYILTEPDCSIKKEDKLSTMPDEFTSVASIVLLAVMISIFMFIMQSRPVHLAVTIHVQLRTDDQRAVMITTCPRVGNRPVPQENDE